MKKFLLITAFAMLGFNAANAETRNSEQVLIHHVEALKALNLEDVLADYNDASVLVTADKTYVGKAQIREIFTNMLPMMEPLKDINVTRVPLSSDVTRQLFHATLNGNNIDGEDIFVVRDGAILFQVILPPKPPAH